MGALSNTTQLRLTTLNYANCAIMGKISETSGKSPMLIYQTCKEVMQKPAKRLRVMRKLFADCLSMAPGDLEPFTRARFNDSCAPISKISRPPSSANSRASEQTLEARVIGIERWRHSH